MHNKYVYGIDNDINYSCKSFIISLWVVKLISLTTFSFASTK